MKKSIKVKLADVLWDAANKHLIMRDYNNEYRANDYTCIAIRIAILNLYPICDNLNNIDDSSEIRNLICKRYLSTNMQTYWEKPTSAPGESVFETRQLERYTYLMLCYHQLKHITLTFNVLTASEREYLMTGMTGADWDALFSADLDEVEVEEDDPEIRLNETESKETLE